MFDGHARLALQKAGHKLRLELLGGSWERRASRSTHRGSLAERSHVSCCTSVQQEPLPTGLAVLPAPWTGQRSWGTQRQGLCSEQKRLLLRNGTSEASTATVCRRFPVTHLPQDEPPRFGDPGLLRPAGRHLHHFGVKHGQAEWGGDPAPPGVDGGQRRRDSCPG